jgi:hypothetical protein
MRLIGIDISVSKTLGIFGEMTHLISSKSLDDSFFAVGSTLNIKGVRHITNCTYFAVTGTLKYPTRFVSFEINLYICVEYGPSMLVFIVFTQYILNFGTGHIGIF